MIRKYSFFSFLLIIIVYAIFQGRFLILGPRISIDYPAQGTVVDAGVVNVSGTARNIAFLSLDDRQIYTDTDGHWQEKLVMQSGVNIIKLSGKDRFGRQKELLVQIVAN
jgi:hypothetical protein